MKSLLNVLILKWGKTNNGCEFIRQPVKFPKERAVTVNFDNREVVGKAKQIKSDIANYKAWKEKGYPKQWS